MKVILTIVGIIVALLVAAFFIVAFSLGSIVKKAVNAKGPEITQSSVVLGSANISPFSGKGTLSNLVVGNPTGWQSENAFTLGQIDIQVEPKSLMSDHIVIDNLVIQHPQIVYETKLTSSNLQDLLKNIQQATGGENQTTEQAKPIKIELRHFELNNAQVTIRAGEKVATVQMPALVLNDLGTQQGGLTPQQLAVAVMKEVTTQAVQAAAKGAVESGLLDQAGAKAGDQLRKLFGSDKSKTTPQPAGK
jgi:uncharacterized protein involved in outer membrane biogenesis